MQKWLSTTWYRCQFGEIHSDRQSQNSKLSQGVWKYNHWNPDTENLDEKLNDLERFCDEEQLSIKSIIPLTRAQTYEYSVAETTVSMGAPVYAYGYGLGQGWGFSNIIGFTALLQKEEHITDEEYTRRLGLIQKKKSLKHQLSTTQNISKNQKDELNQLEKDLEKEIIYVKSLNKTLEEIESIIDTPASEKKGLMWDSFIVGGKKFGSAELAQNYIQDCKDQSKNLKTDIKIQQEKILKIETEITLKKRMIESEEDTRKNLETELRKCDIEIAEFKI